MHQYTVSSHPGGIIEFAHRPEVVDEQVEDAEKYNEQHSAELGLESHDDHNASYGSDQDDQDPPEAPVACKDESNKEEDQEHTSGELEIHLAVLLIHLR